MTRVQSQAQTRQHLMEAATAIFRREGYAMASVERIAEAAGYSKGAVYSNFTDKESIFLEVLGAEGQTNVDELIADLENDPGWPGTVEKLAAWADARSQSGSWALAILEYNRLARSEATIERQQRILRGHWEALGSYLLQRFPAMADDALTLGALVHEIAYAPAITMMKQVSAGDLMRLALRRGT